MNVLVFGEIIWDVYDNNKFIGGAPLNFSIHSSRLNMKPYFISAVGKDELGQSAVDYLTEQNIATDFITFNNFQTGKCCVRLNKDKIPEYNILQNTAYDHINIPSDIKKHNYDAFYFGSLCQRSAENCNNISKILSSFNFKEVFCDINIRKPFYSSSVIKSSFASSSIIKISREELPIISAAVFNNNYSYKDFSKKILTIFPNLKIIIITLDKDGAYVFDCKTKQEYFQNAKKTKVISTVGAGDSFSAAFLSEYLHSADISVCLNKAICLSSFVVSQMSAVPNLS